MLLWVVSGLAGSWAGRVLGPGLARSRLVSPDALATYLRTTEGITRAELKRALRKVFGNEVLAPPGFAKAARRVVHDACE